MLEGVMKGATAEVSKSVYSISDHTIGANCWPDGKPIYHTMGEQSTE